MRHRNEHTLPVPGIWVALAASALMLTAGVVAIDGMTAPVVGRRLLWPLIRLMIVIVVGLAAGQVIEASGWTRKLGILGAPLFRFARLGPRCSAAFTAAFFSGASANAMLYDFWKDGKIDRRRLILTNLANQLPAFFLHLPTTVMIVLPLTGRAGALYYIITLAAVMLRLLVVLLVGRWTASRAAEQDEQEPGVVGKRDRRPAAIAAVLRQKLPQRLMRVATYVIPIYIAVFLLNSAGLFEWTRQWLAGSVASFFLPAEALSLVVVSFAAEFTSGFAAAGALLQEGLLTTKQTILALLIGNVVAFPIRAVRHQLPRLLGIFAPRMGMLLLLLGQGYRIASLILVGGVFYWLF